MDFPINLRLRCFWETQPGPTLKRNLPKKNSATATAHMFICFTFFLLAGAISVESECLISLFELNQ